VVVAVVDRWDGNCWYWRCWREEKSRADMERSAADVEERQ
jgi:hypothetical protein